MVRRIAFGLVALGAGVALATTADATPYRHARVLTVQPVLVPAHLRPDYVGAPGYPGGPPGPRVPTLIDFGFVGTGPTLGVLPATRLFVGVPILGDLGI